MLQEMIDYYEQKKQLMVRQMNKHCSEYYAFEGIKISKLLDALYEIKRDGIFK